MTTNNARTPIRKDEAGNNGTTIDQSIDAVETMLDEMDGFRRFDSAGFDGYVAEQMKAAEGEEGDVKKARLSALRDSMTAAKAAFGEGGSGKARIKAYVAGGDSAEATTTEKTADAAVEVAPLPTFEVMKSVVGSLRHEVNKADGSVVPVAKSGEARATLDRLALAFGLLPYDGETEVSAYRIGWEVQDAVCALDKLAEMEEALAFFGSMGMLAGLAPAGGGADAGGGAADGAVAKGDKSPVVKSDDLPTNVGAIKDALGWPLDMNAK